MRVSVCIFSGYKISSCNANGRFYVTETSASILTCTEINDDYMFWDFTPSGGTGMRRIAACTWSTSTCNITDSDSDYAVTRPQYDNQYTDRQTKPQNKDCRSCAMWRSIQCYSDVACRMQCASCVVSIPYTANRMNQHLVPARCVNGF